jgi:hypothetical protein
VEISDISRKFEDKVVNNICSRCFYVCFHDETMPADSIMSDYFLVTIRISPEIILDGTICMVDILMASSFQLIGEGIVYK